MTNLNPNLNPGLNPDRSEPVGPAKAGSPATVGTLTTWGSLAPIGVATTEHLDGTSIGPYRLLSRLGEGGFGVVYLAQQDTPVRRRVAIKVIKPGMGSREVVGRFSAERQALALMNHPNVATVLDAGETGAGLPYFVMEHVAGASITDYCDKARLPVRERLVLFMLVCDAVQHAHQKGIVHRDIKPSNVLVEIKDDKPVPKVIDFGVAKALHRPLTEHSVYTEQGRMIGTPEYMSPEQAEMTGQDIDTRTDIYSLGVLLYELLTGSLPFEATALRAAGLPEIVRLIRDVDPPKPSTLIRDSVSAEPKSRTKPKTPTSARPTPSEKLAALRRSDPRGLASQLRGDLDWIVMRAIEKERVRRYASASELAADIGRHLRDEPVLAGPPSARYRIQKFAKRNRKLLIAATGVAGALMLGSAATTYGFITARSERDRAVAAEHLAQERLHAVEAAQAESETQTKIATAVTDFFNYDVLDLEPVGPGQPEPTVRQILDKAAVAVDSAFVGKPAQEGAVRERLGNLYRKLSLLDKAEPQLRRAAELLEQGLGPNHRQTTAAIQRMGAFMLTKERYAEAEQYYNDAYQRRRAEPSTQPNFVLNSLLYRAHAQTKQGKTDGPVADAESVLADFVSRLGEYDHSTLVVKGDLCQIYNNTGRFAEAEQLASAVLAHEAQSPSGVGDRVPSFQIQLARALSGLGRGDEAEPLFSSGFETLAKTMPPDHLNLGEIRKVRGMSLLQLGRAGDARRELTAAHAIYAANIGPSCPSAVELARSLAELARKNTDSAEAARWDKLADR